MSPHATPPYPPYPQQHPNAPFPPYGGYPTPPPVPTKSDEYNVDLLGILFWCYGALSVFAALALVVFGLLGGALFAIPPTHGSDAPRWWAGPMFAALWCVGGLFIGAHGVLHIATGSSLRARKRRVLCFIGVALCIMNFPLGSALGIMTIIMLQKPGMKERFDANT